MRGFFTITRLETGEVAFMSCAGNYITAGDGNWPPGLTWLLVAETKTLLGWEQFTLLPP